MKDIFEMRELAEGCPVRVIDIPDLIMKEIDEWVEHSYKTKNHPLSSLKAHENNGYLCGHGIKYNTYQCSIPPSYIENSFWLPWVIRLTAKEFGDRTANHDQYIALSRTVGHYNGYEIWTNFSYKGNKNPSHIHSGNVSGVIYYKNHGHPTIFDDYNVEYEGKNSTMILFPSNTFHRVNEQTEDEERITLAFNIKFNIKRNKQFLSGEYY